MRKEKKVKQKYLKNTNFKSIIKIKIKEIKISIYKLLN